MQFWRNAANKNGDTLGSAKDKLKQRLLDTVQSTRRGISTTEEQRQEIDELIAGLEPCESIHLHAPSVFQTDQWTNFQEHTVQNNDK